MPIRDRLIADEVPKALQPAERIVAAGLAHFERVGGDAMIPTTVSTSASPAGGVIGDAIHLALDAASAKHWWVVVTDRRLLVFRLFAARPQARDSAIALADTCALDDLRVDRAEWSPVGGHLDVTTGDRSYRFHFPAISRTARAVVDAVLQSTQRTRNDGA